MIDWPSLFAYDMSMSLGLTRSVALGSIRPWRSLACAPWFSMRSANGTAISDHDRWAIVHHMKGGAKPAEVARLLGHSRTTVYKWWRRYVSKQHVKPLPNTGRKRIFSEAAEERALDILSQPDEPTAFQARHALREEGYISHHVHESTVIRAAKRAATRAGTKLWCQRGRPRKAMTTATMQKHLSFAVANHNRDWSRVLFTDRKKFQFRYPGSRVNPCRWVKGKAGDTQRSVFQPNHAQVLNVYAGISKYGVTPVHVVAGSSKHTTSYMNNKGKAAKNITAQECRDVMKKTLLHGDQMLFSVQGISTWFCSNVMTPHTGVLLMWCSNGTMTRGLVCSCCSHGLPTVMTSI